MMRTLLLAATAATLALGAPAFAQRTNDAQIQTGGGVGAPLASATVITDADKEFIKMAGQSGLLEVQLGKLAQEKATNPQVKQFAAEMVEHHTASNTELKGILSRYDMDDTPELGDKHEALVKKLKGLEGSQFDQAYMQAMVEDHQTAVQAFQKQANAENRAQTQGDPMPLQDFAKEHLPGLQRHLQMAQSIHSELQSTASSK